MHLPLSVLLWIVPAAHASHGATQIATPLTNAEASLFLLYANPPLPMLYFGQGDYKMTLMGDFFSVQKPAAFKEVAEVSVDGSMTGWGGAVLYDKAVSDGVSLYGILLGAQLGSGRLEGRALPEDVGKVDTIFQRSNSDGSLSVGATIGFNKRLRGESSGQFTLSAFVGPIVYYTKGSGASLFLNLNTAQDSTACPEAFAQYNCVSRAYSAKVATFGLLAGLQAGVPVGESFTLNPFFLAMPTAALFSGEDNQVVQLDKAIQVGTSGGGQVVTDRVGMIRGLGPVSLGANLTYKPWGLTFNLTGSLITPFLASLTGELSSYRILKFQLSKSFGHYPR